MKEQTLDLKDITRYKNVGVTELRDNLKDFIEGDDASPVVVYQRSEPKKVLVDYETWMQLLRNSDPTGQALVKDELKDVLRKLLKD